MDVPTISGSLSGESTTLSGCRACSPAVAVITPPSRPTSCPRMKPLRRPISLSSAERMAAA